MVVIYLCTRQTLPIWAGLLVELDKAFVKCDHAIRDESVLADEDYLDPQAGLNGGLLCLGSQMESSISIRKAY